MWMEGFSDEIGLRIWFVQMYGGNWVWVYDLVSVWDISSDGGSLADTKNFQGLARIRIQ